MITQMMEKVDNVNSLLAELSEQVETQLKNEDKEFRESGKYLYILRIKQHLDSCIDNALALVALDSNLSGKTDEQIKEFFQSTKDIFD